MIFNNKYLINRNINNIKKYNIINIYIIYYKKKNKLK